MLFFDLFRDDPNPVRIKAGERLFRQGDPGDVMYILLTGEVEVTMDGLSIEVSKPGDILGEMAVIDDCPRSATVTARTDCELAVIDKKRFNFLVDETPRFAIDVMRVMARRLKQSDQRLSGSAAGSVPSSAALLRA
jgi:CRP-like cAMP-binding protein